MAGKIKKFITSPAGTMGAFALAVGLLASSSVGGARAALTYYSETYTSRVQMYDIGVTLLENDEKVIWKMTKRFPGVITTAERITEAGWKKRVFFWKIWCRKARSSRSASGIRRN